LSLQFEMPLLKPIIHADIVGTFGENVPHAATDAPTDSTVMILGETSMIQLFTINSVMRCRFVLAEESDFYQQNALLALDRAQLNAFPGPSSCIRRRDP